MQPESALEHGGSWGPRSQAVPTSDLNPTGFEQNLAPAWREPAVGLGGFRANITHTASGPVLALAPQPWVSLCP